LSYLEENEPCFFADCKLSKDKKTIEWTVGVYNDKEAKNHTVKIKKNNSLWGVANNSAFGVILVEAYKKGGKEEVDQAVANIVVAD